MIAALFPLLNPRVDESLRGRPIIGIRAVGHFDGLPHPEGSGRQQPHPLNFALYQERQPFGGLLGNRLKIATDDVSERAHAGDMGKEKTDQQWNTADQHNGKNDAAFDGSNSHRQPSRNIVNNVPKKTPPVDRNGYQVKRGGRRRKPFAPRTGSLRVRLGLSAATARTTMTSERESPDSEECRRPRRW